MIHIRIYPTIINKMYQTSELYILARYNHLMSGLQFCIVKIMYGHTVVVRTLSDFCIIVEI